VSESEYKSAQVVFRVEKRFRVFMANINTAVMSNLRHPFAENSFVLESRVSCLQAMLEKHGPKENVDYDIINIHPIFTSRVSSTKHPNAAPEVPGTKASKEMSKGEQRALGKGRTFV
jgi:hypothetical protein